MGRKVFRVSKTPHPLQSLLGKFEHLLVKEEDGSIRCETHQQDAAKCVPARKGEQVWTNSLDGGLYLATVTRTGPYRGELVLVRGERVVLWKEVDLTYDAPFGPDEEDVFDWKDACVTAVDADYLAGAERPKRSP